MSPWLFNVYMDGVVGECYCPCKRAGVAKCEW